MCSSDLMSDTTDHKANLKNLLTDVACRGQGWNSRSAGWWLARNVERVIGGRCFKREGNQHPKWVLAGAKSLKDQEKETMEISKQFFNQKT